MTRPQLHLTKNTASHRSERTQRFTARWAKMYAREKEARTAAQGYDSDEEYAGIDVVQSMETVEQVISVVEVEG